MKRARVSGPARALFGMETEFAVTAIGHDDSVLPGGDIVRRICARAAARPHLQGDEAGIFLPNGGRFYADVGNHPEYAAPETTNPWDAVRYALAGDRLVSQLAQEVAAETAVRCLFVRKGNVDYASKATFASHENFLHAGSPDRLRPALIPHLVSRVLFTGGGGFDPFDDRRARFVLSPRALFIRHVVAPSAPGAVALVDERTQPHCAGFHRQHVMCGDGNQSHLALLLRIGTTALVVALIEADAAGTEAVALANPLAALRTVSRDVTLQRPLDLASGQQRTAIDIQRHYLRCARAHLVRLPAWAGALCDVWHGTLDLLERGPDAVADRLDWAIKRAVYRDRAARRRLVFNDGLPGARRARPQTETSTWRAELCEIDLRYGEVYPSGVFDALDQAGVLCHRVARTDDIDRAVFDPPPEGRARVRGRTVMRLAGGPGLICGWDAIRDTVSRQTLDLADPFSESEAWGRLDVECPAEVLIARLSFLARSPAAPDVTQSMRALAERFAGSEGQASTRLSWQHAIDLNNLAFEVRNAGRFEDAEWLMRAALAIDLAVRPPDHPKIAHRRNNLATVLLLQRRLDDAREQAALAWQLIGSGCDLTGARVLTIRLAIALVDGEPSEVFVGQLKTHLAIDPLDNLAGADRHWQIAPVLDAIASMVGTDGLGLLKAVTDVLNGAAARGSLEGLPLWRQAAVQSLDTPWPITCDGGGPSARDTP